MLAVFPASSTTTRPARVHLLRELLRDEVVNAGSRSLLPSESELCARHGEPRNVVRDALGLLREERVIERRQGVGTFAVISRPEHRATTLYFVGEDIGSSVARFETLAVDSIPAAPAVARRLGVEIGCPLVSVQRRTWLDDRPFSLQASLLPMSIAGWLLDRPPDGEWYQALEEGGLALGRAEQVVEATVADAHVGALLHVDVGSPVMLLQRLMTVDDARPVEFGVVRCRGDRVAVRFTAQRGDAP